jgi:16S rRNA (cytosine967-C5)-methyltransferase
MDKRKKRDAREVSLLALQRVDEEGAFANLALDGILSNSIMDPRDKGLAAEITYGVITYKSTLDWMISQVAGRPVKKLDRLILQILRIGFYQLFYLDRIPAPAAVHSTVELVKRGKKKGLASFVNGVMRGALRKKDTLPWPDRAQDEVAYLSLRYAHPDWLVRRWLSRYGSSDTEALLAANNRPAPLTLRVNTLRTDRQSLIATLAGEGMEAVPSDVNPDSVTLKTGGRLTGLQSYREGLFQVQGESAILTSRLLAPLAGESVLDGCSAPGGKTTHLAQLMKNSGDILALDIYPHRLELVEANCKRLGVTIVRTDCLDAREITADRLGRFDKVLLDVPCSGFGVIRRKPDLKWRRKESDIKQLAQVQKDILCAAAGVLKPGGKLLYSTCTNEPEETSDVVTHAVKENQHLAFSDFTSELPAVWQPDATESGIHLLPHIHGVDGFFISIISKGRVP